MFDLDRYSEGYEVGYEEGRRVGFDAGYEQATLNYETRLNAYWAELHTLNARMDYLQHELERQGR